MFRFKYFLANKEHHWTDNEIINLYLNNTDKKIQELSSETGKSIGEIYRILHNNYIKPNRLKVNHYNVITLINAGMPIIEVSKLTGYTVRNIRYILEKYNNA